MASERDPRVDPMPGDVLDTVEQRREVVCCPPRMVQFVCPSCGPGDIHTIYASTWRKWARNAEVIQRGDEHGK